MSLNKDGFLKPFADFIAKGTQTNYEWARCLAINCLSTAVGPHVKVYTQKGPLNLNLFFVNIGASGLTIKTIPLRDYVLPTLKKLEDLTNKKFLFPSGFTSEGFHEYLLEKEVMDEDRVIQTQKSGCIIKDELSRFFKEASGKRYMAGQIEFFSELYDGWVKSKYTKSSQLQGLVRPFVNLVAASTPYLFTILPKQIFLQGFGNRILWICSGSGILEKADPEKYFHSKFEDRRLGFIDEFAEKLKNYHEHSEGRIFIFSPEAGRNLTTYEFIKRSEAESLFHQDMMDATYSYIVRLPEYAFKLSGIHAIDRSGHLPWKSDTDEVIDITEQDAMWAMHVADEHLANFKKLLEVWETVRRSARTSKRRRDPDEMKAILEKAGGIMNQTELRRKMYSRGYNPDRYVDVMLILTNAEDIILTKIDAEKDEPKKPGPKPEYFILKSHPKFEYYKKKLESAKSSQG